MLEFYSIGDVQKLLGMPLKTFWMLHKNIDRLVAERSLNHLQISAYCQSQEGVKALTEQFTAQMGRVVEFDEAKHRMKATLDREGLNDLRSLASAF